MNALDEILKANSEVTIENGIVYNCFPKSESAQFYSEIFSENFKTISKPELFHNYKTKHWKKGNAYRIMEQIVSYLEKNLTPEAIVIEIGGGISQNRSAFAYRRFKNYFPLDISTSSISRYSKKFGLKGIIADAKEMPFKDNSIDCIFTHTFLEHPLNPELVLNEIVRVLKPGGIVLHNDAWFCRWWQRYGIVGLKKFGNLSFKEKMIVVAAKVTELPIVRIPPILIKRLFRQFYIRKKEVDLLYKKLKPNYNLHLGCDEDAANSIDPINVIRFYESRRFTLVNPLSFLQRLIHPNKYILLKKSK